MLLQHYNLIFVNRYTALLQELKETFWEIYNNFKTR
jgi:hypothetical protein